ncbi:uncharacterized protein LOC115672870 isoform X2 [Syzygium oleosum]|uniref:uncharacterized protein LOC115672870 isoform X2 n=1 Tax=Syzygium oleosum TaxID=219896 RepID=UPI0024BB0E01|nr:uncharacterized protein LOC115672870 isoform X2 [Syzygium oleosum]
MVLGLKAKARKSASVKLHYLIHIQEIKPWPPSQSLKSVRSALVQWENGEKHSGSTSSVVPSLSSGVNDGKIEFNESFRLPVTLLRDTSAKSGDGDAFQKNCLEFHLYEPRRDRTLKGQLLGTASVDLADYGVIKDAISITAQMNCHRNFRNTAQPVLYVNIQPVDKGSLSFSSKESLEMQSSLDKNGSESVAALMREEYAAEAEMTSFTDDDVSSHASVSIPSSPLRSNGILPPQNEQSGSVAIDETIVRIEENHLLASDPVLELTRSDVTSEVAVAENLQPAESLLPSSSCSSSFDLSSDPGCLDNGNASSISSGRSSSMAFPKAGGHSAHSSISSCAIDQAEEESIIALSYSSESLTQDALGESESGGETLLNAKDILITSARLTPSGENLDIMDGTDAQVIDDDNKKCLKVGQDDVGKNSATDGIGGNGLEEENGTVGLDSVDGLSVDAASEQKFLTNDEFSSGGESHGMKGHVIDRLRHAKSVRSPADIAKSIGTASAHPLAGPNKEGAVTPIGVRSFRSNERRDAKVYAKDTGSALLEAKVQQLEHRIKMLEGELIEAAAVEVALFSVIAEHGSSMAKVHAPARRLSRLYIHACRELSHSRRASAARSAVSGLVLVAKACGNDVPRLMYWLSNSVVLRTIISGMTQKMDLSLSSSTQSSKDNAGKQSVEIPSSLKWKSSSHRNGNANGGTVCDWEDHNTFVSALERVETWIFSRAIESIWWQTLTPYMQSTTIKATDIMDSSLNESGERVTHEDVRGDISLDHWKKAFRDACERLCPVRAVGHECGCLPMLARLIMEQCVGRLDVAMFNAILRDSANGIPSDPISDPISDPKVLPIPVGTSSFGIGAQLKNTIGNWSRWLTDLFGRDDTDLPEDESEYVDDEGKDSSFKSFHLLSALSDLMMLPKDMLLSRSIRKEVCPMFAASLIKRVLDNFVPDEFCPDSIPDGVLEALESEVSSLSTNTMNCISLHRIIVWMLKNPLQTVHTLQRLQYTRRLWHLLLVELSGRLLQILSLDDVRRL